MAAVAALPVSLSGRFKGSVTAWRARYRQRGGGQEGADGLADAPAAGERLLWDAGPLGRGVRPSSGRRAGGAGSRPPAAGGGSAGVPPWTGPLGWGRVSPGGGAVGAVLPPLRRRSPRGGSLSWPASARLAPAPRCGCPFPVADRHRPWEGVSCVSVFPRFLWVRSWVPSPWDWGFD